MTTIAVPPNVRPEIVCPSWCVISQEDHIADLPNWEGRVIHWSALTERVNHSSETYPDGTPVLDDEPPMIWINGLCEDLTVDEAERLAEAILAAVKEARA